MPFLPAGFKRIKGYENYAINLQGEILSISRKMWNGHKYWQSKNRMLKPTVAKNGYLVVGFSVGPRNNHNSKTKYIHRLLALTFISNPQNKKCINHKDGNKLNNSLENLEWCNYRQIQEKCGMVIDIGNQKIEC